MADKHQAFVFESYPNKRQFPSLMGVFIKSTWLRGASSPHRPSSMRPTNLSAPGSDEDGNKNFQIHKFFFCFSSLSGIDLTPQVNLKHFFFFLLLLTFAHVDQIVPCVKFTALKSCTLALCPEDVTAALGLLCLSYSAC